MRKFLLLAGIFTVLVCNTAKAERYYEEDGYTVKIRIVRELTAGTRSYGQMFLNEVVSL